MATSISQVFAVNATGVVNGTTRTFTTTRLLRVFDMRAQETAVVAGLAATLTISNGLTVITSVATPNPPVLNTIYRLGNELANSTCDDAQMAVAAGGTIVFATNTVDTFDMTAICYPQ